MLKQTEITRKLEAVFNPHQAIVLAEVVTDAYDDLVKTSDFSELKAIVRELAEAQKRTEGRIGRLETTVAELAEAQKRTESRVEELAEVQKETQYQIQALTHQLRETNNTLGGLGRSFSYALENEAYRMIPALLKERYGIEMRERFVRTHIGGEEINLFGRGRRDGQEVLLVGEVKLRLDERRVDQTGEPIALTQLATKVEAVQQEYPDEEIVPVLITHYARPGMLQVAQERGVIVIQSFEW